MRTAFTIILILTISITAFSLGNIQTGSMEPGASAMFNRSIVRDSGGWLYAACRNTETTTKSVWISRSTDSGLSWDQDWQEVTDTSGFGRDNLISGCSMTIDESDNLYVVWHRYQYSPTYHATYLRKCINTRTSPIWDPIHEVFEADIKTDDSGVAIDSAGYIWILSGGPSSWKAQLWKSNAPYAAGYTFTNKGCPSSGSCQGASMVVDSNNKIHVSYYDNGVSSYYAIKRVYNGTSWEPYEGMGNGTTGGADNNCGLAADLLGNVHVLYGDNTGATTSTWFFRYRLWDPETGLGDPVDIINIPTSLYSGVVNRYISNICCNEITGEVFVVIRNLNVGGSMCLYTKALEDTAFTFIEELTDTSMGVHYFYEPRMRGSLYPAFNRTGSMVEMSWTENRSASPHEPFYRYQLSEGPYLTYFFPPSGSWVSEDTAIQLYFTDIEGIDVSTLELSVNGITYTVSDPEISALGDTIFIRDLPLWNDGDTVIVELTALSDILGHGTPDTGATLEFYIDKAPPEIVLREPDSAQISAFVPTGALLQYRDVGSGTDSTSWILTVRTHSFMAPSGDGLIIEGDSLIIVSFSAAGITIPDDDTSWIEFAISDHPDIGFPNLKIYRWWFLPTIGIVESRLPEKLDFDISPNPFNSAVRLRFRGAAGPEGAEGEFGISIFDLSGRLVAELPLSSALRGEKESFSFSPAAEDAAPLVWQPESGLPSGIYFFRLDIGGETITKTGVYLK